MDLVLYLLAISLISLGSFWLMGMIYGLLHKPAIYFPLGLASKMAASAIFGALLFMIGGIVLSTLVFNHAMAKRPEYKKWPSIVSGLIISVICSVIIYVSAFFLAWEILG